MYFICPDTDNLTLEDIERHFANNSKKITDWKITKSVDLLKNSNLEGTEMAEDTSERKEVEEEISLIGERYKMNNNDDRCLD